MSVEPNPISRAFYNSCQSPEPLEALRADCASSPEDLEKRARLLGALSFRRGPEPSAELVDEALWWLRNHPAELRHVAMVMMTLSQAPYPAYKRLRDAWEPVLAERGSELEVALVAAQFFQFQEPDRALEMLESADAAETDPRPARQAGQIWWFRSLRFSSQDETDRDRTEARQALRWFERALEREPEPERRLGTLPTVCEVALAAGDPGRARALAEELISLAESTSENWSTGNALFTGQSILGQAALAEGDVERAKEHLARAGRTPGSPQLNSFGPKLHLANALLQRGERDAVLEFLREIRRFWTYGHDRIDLWCLEIERGSTPSLINLHSP